MPYLTVEGAAVECAMWKSEDPGVRGETEDSDDRVGVVSGEGDNASLHARPLDLRHQVVDGIAGVAAVAQRRSRDPHLSVAAQDALLRVAGVLGGLVGELAIQGSRPRTRRDAHIVLHMVEAAQRELSKVRTQFADGERALALLWELEVAVRKSSLQGQDGT